MTARLRNEEKRLAAIFRAARTIALTAPPVVLALACGADDPSFVGAGGAGGASVDGESVFESATPLLASPIAATGENASCGPQEFTPNPPDACGDYVRLPCGLPAGITPGSRCYLYLNDCKKICPEHYFNCHAVDDSCKDGQIVKDAKGGIDIDCATCAHGVGRVPAGLAPARFGCASSPLGTWFASAAHLEAASVHAFRRMRAELAAHGAPRRLRRAARLAQRDEVRHAARMGRMARRHGGARVAPRVAALPTRALDAVAIENAVEGCVRETFGALVASFQAANAEDAGIARLMRTIARDETRHAALSWSVARWAYRRLGAGARANLVERCKEAVASLRDEACAPVPADLAARAGVPTAAQQRALIGVLEAQLWSRLGDACRQRSGDQRKGAKTQKD